MAARLLLRLKMGLLLVASTAFWPGCSTQNDFLPVSWRLLVKGRLRSLQVRTQRVDWMDVYLLIQFTLHCVIVDTTSDAVLLLMRLLVAVLPATWLSALADTVKPAALFSECGRVAASPTGTHISRLAALQIMATSTWSMVDSTSTTAALLWRNACDAVWPNIAALLEPTMVSAASAAVAPAASGTPRPRKAPAVSGEACVLAADMATAVCDAIGAMVVMSPGCLSPDLPKVRSWLDVS
jgi:hypothetical protein